MHPSTWCEPIRVHDLSGVTLCVTGRKHFRIHVCLCLSVGLSVCGPPCTCVKLAGWLGDQAGHHIQITRRRQILLEKNSIFYGGGRLEAATGKEEDAGKRISGKSMRMHAAGK